MKPFAGVMPTSIQGFAIIGLGALLSSITFGQATTSAPTFEVASVKVNTSGESATSENFENGRLPLLNIPMKVIVARAYQVTNDRIAGPDWLDFDRFDIIAKSAPDTTGDTMWLMRQNLLADRFHLTIHHEQTAVPVYALVAAKTGPKFKEASADSPEKVTCSRPDSQVTCRNQKTTMAQLAQNLPRWVSRNFFDLPVLDRTELHGVYDFSLTWSLTNRPDDPADVSLFDAIEDQLGLKLERQKVPVDRIVIDHLERVPTEN
jgi:uncharacterized protein (TIGR03435 family)